MSAGRVRRPCKSLSGGSIGEKTRSKSGTAPGEAIQGPFQEPRIEMERQGVEMLFNSSTITPPRQRFKT